MKSVLVTGGAGFIGSHVVDRFLELGWQVTALDNFDPFYPEAVKLRNIARHQDYQAYRLVRADRRVCGYRDGCRSGGRRLPGWRDLLRLRDLFRVADLGLMPEVGDSAAHFGLALQ